MWLNRNLWNKLAVVCYSSPGCKTTLIYYYYYTPNRHLLGPVRSSSISAVDCFICHKAKMLSRNKSVINAMWFSANHPWLQYLVSRIVCDGKCTSKLCRRQKFPIYSFEQSTQKRRTAILHWLIIFRKKFLEYLFFHRNIEIWRCRVWNWNKNQCSNFDIKVYERNWLFKAFIQKELGSCWTIGLSALLKEVWSAGLL